jgi:hypothetical protein
MQEKILRTETVHLFCQFGVSYLDGASLSTHINLRHEDADASLDINFANNTNEPTTDFL